VSARTALGSDAAVDTRAEWDWLAGIYFPVMIAVTLVVVAAFVYPVLRYRSRGRAPSQHSEAPRLEWTLRHRAARRKAKGAARQREAMGRSKEDNYTVVAGALGTAMGQATVMQPLTLVHLDKQKKTLAARPKPEPPPTEP
jgi:hypothetical protein